jgi:hypothetical protein
LRLSTSSAFSLNGDPWGSECDDWGDMAAGIVSAVSSPLLWFAGVERASTLRSIFDDFEGQTSGYL